MAVADIYLLSIFIYLSIVGIVSTNFTLVMLVCWLSAVYQAVDSEQLFHLMKKYLFPWHKKGGNNNTGN